MSLSAAYTGAFATKNNLQRFAHRQAVERRFPGQDAGLLLVWVGLGASPQVKNTRPRECSAQANIRNGRAMTREAAGGRDARRKFSIGGDGAGQQSGERQGPV